MFFKLQTWIFVQLITFQALSSIYVSRSLNKKEFCWSCVLHLYWSMINLEVCWSTSVKSSNAKCLSNAVVILPSNCREKTLNMFFLTVVSKQKNKKRKYKNTTAAWHGTFFGTFFDTFLARHLFFCRSLAFAYKQ